MNAHTLSPIERRAFRDAMSRLTAAVHLVTTDGPAGRRGVTVTSVCSVSDAPPTLLVCLNTSNPMNERFEANGVFAVHLLGRAAEPVARVFAGEGKLEAEERFAHGRWGRLATGAPVLEDALAVFDCRVADARIVATHRVLIGEVADIRVGSADRSLLYRDRGYHHF